MQRSRKRKLRRSQALMRGMPLASSLLVAATPAYAQQTSAPIRLDEVIVTAQKREENLQQVPLSIQALGTEKLEELNITDFDDYVKFLPSVSYQTFGPGFALVYMRGVASGGDGNHSGSLPSVGMYLDEQPITNIQGPLDIHLYDIARVEALAGPQGTLYGASSQAGTIRIITNKPDPSGFDAGYSLEASSVHNGDPGYLAEGFVNLPVSENAAIRLVGWKRHDGGFIDNVEGSRVFPSAGTAVSNANLAEKRFNDVDTIGARAALRIDLNDNWTVTPALMGQEQEANGVFGYDPNVGDLAVVHYYPDKSKDRWTQAALTVEGRISNLDVTYAGAFLNRDVDTDLDYSDYSYWYDYYGGYGAYITDDAGNPTTGQYIQGKDRYERTSHELRFSTSAEYRLRFVGGLFWQQQEHGIEQRYLVDNLAAASEVTGWPDTIWLTQQFRVDQDEAIFGELSYDLTAKLTATGGLRFFRTENSLKGFFGYGDWGWSSTGEASCIDPADFRGAPCLSLDKVVREEDSTGKINFSYRFDEERMVYATWSEGFRPGGINRRVELPPYKADFLTNYELGWKTSWADGRLRFNGAVFLQEWEDFQFSLLGTNGLTEIKNSAQAEIRGIEADLTWIPTDNLTLSGGVAFIDSELTENYCGFVDENGNPESRNPCPTFDDDGNPITVAPEAPKGTELPVTPSFKGNLTARYDWNVGEYAAYLQGAYVYKGESRADLRDLENSILGDQPSYSIVDFSAGFDKGPYSVSLFIANAFDERAVLFRFVQCAETVCGNQPYIVTNQPRTIGLKFSQKF